MGTGWEVDGNGPHGRPKGIRGGAPGYVTISSDLPYSCRTYREGCSLPLPVQSPSSSRPIPVQS
eukprot:11451815-Karenia_brevis.AAC.1